MLFLRKVNPKIDWANKLVRVKGAGRWVKLPIVCSFDALDGIEGNNSCVGAENWQVEAAGNSCDVARAAGAPQSCTVEIESASKFARTLKGAEIVFVGFLEQLVGEGHLQFTHRAAHGDSGTTKVGNVDSEAFLDEMQEKYPAVFSEPSYPLRENRVPF